jgi:hypothetical protein
MGVEYKFYVPVDLAQKLIDKGIVLRGETVREMVTAYLKLKEAGISNLELGDVINFRNELKKREDIMKQVFNLRTKKNLSLSKEELLKHGGYTDMDVIKEALDYYEYFEKKIPLEVIATEEELVRNIVKEFVTPNTPESGVLIVMFLIIHRLAELKPDIIKDIFKKKWVENYTTEQIIQVIDGYLNNLK